MKRALPMIVVLAVLAWAPAVWGQSADACKTPFIPNNIFKFLLNYTPTLEWIAQSQDETCRSPFIAKLKENVNNTWVMTQGCIDVTIDDIELAEKQRRVATQMSSQEKALAIEKLDRDFPKPVDKTSSQNGEG